MKNQILALEKIIRALNKKQVSLFQKKYPSTIKMKRENALGYSIGLNNFINDDSAAREIETIISRLSDTIERLKRLE